MEIAFVAASYKIMIDDHQVGLVNNVPEFKVDAVSGATMSSVAIMNAVEVAVQKAR